MGTPDEMINAVREALAPGADSATRQKAAGVLRALLAVVEAAPGASLAAALVPSPPPSIGASPADLFGAIIEKLRPYLPSDAALTVARLNIPLVPLPKP